LLLSKPGPGGSCTESRIVSFLFAGASVPSFGPHHTRAVQKSVTLTSADLRNKETPYYPPPEQSKVETWVTPPWDFVNIPEIGNVRCFWESLLAKGPWYGPCRRGVINNVTLLCSGGGGDSKQSDPLSQPNLSYPRARVTDFWAARVLQRAFLALLFKRKIRSNFNFKEKNFC